MKTWIFSNDIHGYGKEIRRACIDDCVNRRVPFRVVFSGKGWKPTIDRDDWSSPKKVVRHFRRLARYTGRVRRIRRESGYRPLVVGNVKSKTFRMKIAPEDIGVIAGFNQIFRSKTIARFRKFVNVHPSVLPLYRGPIPSFWCLKNRETRTGFSVHVVTRRIDDGEILYQHAVDIEPGMAEEELDRLISSSAAVVMPRVLSALREETELERQRLDAHSIYRVHVEYAGFRDR